MNKDGDLTDGEARRPCQGPKLHQHASLLFPTSRRRRSLAQRTDRGVHIIAHPLQVRLSAFLHRIVGRLADFEAFGVIVLSMGELAATGDDGVLESASPAEFPEIVEGSSRSG